MTPPVIKCQAIIMNSSGAKIVIYGSPNEALNKIENLKNNYSSSRIKQMTKFVYQNNT